MSCMTAIIARSPLGLNISVSRPEGVDADILKDLLDITANIRRDYIRCALGVNVENLGIVPRVRYINSNIKLGITLTCSVSSEEPPYLDIDPKILWMWSAPVDNEVISNTDWIVN